MTLTIPNPVRCAALVAALAFPVQLHAAAAEPEKTPPPTQAELIAIIKSDAPPADKALACKRLAIYGKKDAVAVLAPFLSDEKLASWARIGLEANPDPAVGEVLRDAMGRLQGKLLIGVINSIGVRRDGKAVNALIEKLKDSDAEVASAAAAALGRIGGETAVSVLEVQLTSAPAGVRVAVAEGCILCAERFLAAGKSAEAMNLYDAVRSANVCKQRTVEATRGAILARGSAGVPLLVEQLRSSDKTFFNIGLRTARELPGPEVAKALLAEMERAAPQRQSYLLLAMADRGDAEALPAALKMAKSSSVPQRLVAIGVLEHIGNSSCLPVLMAIAGESESEAAQAAKSALIRLPGADVDAAVIAMLKQPDENARRAALELVAQRRLTSAMPDLLKAAEDASPAISTASLRALGELAGEAEIPALINIMMKAKQTGAAEAALSAVSARLSRPVTGNVVIQKAVYGDLPDGPQADVTAKMADLVKTGATSVQASNKNFGDPAGGRVKKLRVDYTINGIAGSKTVRENDSIGFSVSAPSPAFVDALCAAMGQAPTSGKLALLRVLRSAGGPKALAVVRAAMRDSNSDIRETAFSALCQWPTEDALPELGRLAKEGADQRQKILALRGYIRLIGEADMTPDKKMASLKDAMPLIQRDDERKLALGALGSVASPDALAMVMPQIANAALKEEACAAAVSIAEKIVARNKAVVADAMKQVLQAKPNDEVIRRARVVLRDATGGKPAGKAGRGKGARK